MSDLIVNYGSINVDFFYRVPHLVQPGETIASRSVIRMLGGKGANQSAAAAMAGGRVFHIGQLGTDDGWALEQLSELGVNVDHVSLADGPSGHAIIQVDDQGENAIVLFPGANHSQSPQSLAAALDQILGGKPGGWLLLQNECNALAEAMAQAARRRLKVVFNPAPMTDEVKALPLHQLDTLIVNRGEATALTGLTSVDGCLDALQRQLPNTRIVFTLGAQGALMARGGQVLRQAAPAVDVVDTTGAGDTFAGFLVTALSQGRSDPEALAIAVRASAQMVTRKGTIDAIAGLSVTP